MKLEPRSLKLQALAPLNSKPQTLVLKNPRLRTLAPSAALEGKAQSRGPQRCRQEASRIHWRLGGGDWAVEIGRWKGQEDG